ncbi:hypothetical protein TRFO_14211 [Tritrichomonas foetus]|uniref:Ubiquitin-like domain-containing protein n=1 Tax=Tritrichomonas foetus TaxID=1144522 RepID=A0A1J4KVH0_9EUKA|nr:hypothetical protein TRFO_14211 [Tritrichomonas foetus]|eukprot:OHT15305.1 hypothetical protein TRFO_14211 [Tritrichomonas foetus]
MKRLSYLFIGYKEQEFTLDLPPATTILEIKGIIISKYHFKSIEKITIIFAGEILRDNLPISSIEASSEAKILIETKTFRPNISNPKNSITQSLKNEPHQSLLDNPMKQVFGNSLKSMNHAFTFNQMHNQSSNNLFYQLEQSLSNNMNKDFWSYAKQIEEMYHNNQISFQEYKKLTNDLAIEMKQILYQHSFTTNEFVIVSLAINPVNCYTMVGLNNGIIDHVNKQSLLTEEQKKYALKRVFSEFPINFKRLLIQYIFNEPTPESELVLSHPEILLSKYGLDPKEFDQSLFIPRKNLRKEFLYISSNYQFDKNDIVDTLLETNYLSKTIEILSRK